MSEDEQGQNLSAGEQKPGLIYLGLVLLAVGTVIEFTWLADYDTDWPLIVGMLLCVTGVLVYGSGQRRSWVWRLCWSAYNIWPIFGAVGSLLGLFLDALVPKSSKVTAQLVIATVFFFWAGIATPGYMTYRAKARQSEAKVGLGGIFITATSLKAETETYEISDIKKLGWTPQNARKYSFWYSVNGVPTMIPAGSEAKGPCDVTTPPTTVKVGASKTGFTAAAKGNTDSDATCDEWSINDKRELMNTLNDISQ